MRPRPDDPPRADPETHWSGTTVSRRGFLVAGGALLLAACGSDGGSKGASDTGGKNALSFAVGSSSLAVRPTPQRFAFIAQRGTEYLKSPVSIRFLPPGGEWTASTKAKLHTQGLREGFTLYTTDATLDAVGTADNPWQAEITADGQTATGYFMVRATSVAPDVGQPAPRTASPTPTDTLGVDPICTRSPACDLHSTSLAAVVGARPLAVMFATPARCQTQLCAPSLDQLLAVGPQYDNVDSVHVEIYKDKTGPDVSPTVAAWNLDSEPFFYTVDAAGTIVGRLDGAFAQDEVQALVEQLAKG